MARAIVLFLLAAALVLQSSTSTAQVGSTRLLGSISPPDTGAAKFPSVATSGNRLFLTGNVSDRARLWTKTDSATVFDGTPVDLGAGTGKDDFQNVAVATGPDGTAYSVWNSVNQGVFLRTRAPNGTLGPQRTVVSGVTFRVFVDVGVTTDNVIIVTWYGEEFGGDNPRNFVTTSRDGGATWSNPQQLVDENGYRSAARIATGPNGSAIIAYYGFPAFNIYASIWNGSSFTRELVSRGGGGYQPADPTSAISGNGTFYAAWRTVTGDVYYGERQANGTWGRSRLASGGTRGVTGPVSIAADAGNNLHLAWTSDAAGAQPDAYYAFKPVGQDWRGPFQTPAQGYGANADVAASLTDQAYGHVVFERFVGDSLLNRYLLWGTPVTTPINADPSIEGGAKVTNKTTVAVSFSNVAGAPNQIRWKWGAPPTDTNNDSKGASGGYVAYTNPLQVALPAGTTACQTLTLYTQVRNGSNVDTTVGNSSVLFDNVVQGSASVSNPDIKPGLSTYAQGANNGSPEFTRESTINVTINNNGDCSGFKSYRIGADGQAQTWDDNLTSVTIQRLVDPAILGRQSTEVAITDELDNTATYRPLYFFYDPKGDANRPVLGSGTVAVSDTNSLIRTLRLSNFAVDDRVYGESTGLASGQQFWGVSVAVSKERYTTDQEINAAMLMYSAIPVSNPGPSFSVDISLATGQNGTSIGGYAGTYYVYVKALDGAGNPSLATIVSGPLQLTAGYSVPQTRLPLVNRLCVRWFERARAACAARARFVAPNRATCGTIANKTPNAH